MKNFVILILKEFGLYHELTPEKFIRGCFRFALKVFVTFILYWVLRYFFIHILPDADSEIWMMAMKLYERNIFEWVFGLLGVLLFLVSFLRIFFEVRFSLAIIVGIYAFAVILLLEDLFWNEFDFYSFKSISVKYYWILFIVPIAEILVRILYVLRKKVPASETSILIENQPLRNLDGLQSTRKHVVGKLVEEINKSHFESAYSIGITGEWGVGKTSFMKAVEKSLDSSSIVIYFNPWSSSGRNSVLQDFLNTLSEKLKEYDSSLVDSMTQYINSMIEIEKSTQTNFANVLREFVSAPMSKDARFEVINRTINRLGKRLVIFIDDLDRLDSTEIIDVLKLIRDAANFSNVVYVSCYDKMYLLHALMRFNKRNLGIMLDKFFDIEISVAPIVQEDLIARIDQHFFSKVADGKSSQISNLKKFLRTHSPFVQYREVNRFLTSLWLNYNIYGSKLFLEDFFIFEIIKVKYAYLPAMLWRSREMYFSEDSSPAFMSLRSNSNQETMIAKDLELRNSNAFNRLFLLPEDFDFLAAAFKKLFKEDNNHYLAIRQPIFFQAYFYHEIPDVDVDESSFALVELINKGTYETHVYFMSGFDFKKEAFLMDKYADEIVNVDPPMQGFKLTTFFVFLIDWSGGAINQQFVLQGLKGSDNTKDYLEIVKTAFRNHISLESLFSRMMFIHNHLESVFENGNGVQPILFQIEDLIFLNSELFEKYLDLSKQFTNTTFRTIYFQLDSLDVEAGTASISGKAMANFKSFINNHPVDYLDLVIRGTSESNHDLKFVFEIFTFRLFKLSEFRTLINQAQLPERRKNKLLQYLDKSKPTENGTMEFKIDEEELSTIPVEFINMWATIPENLKQKKRFSIFETAFKFTTQRNDHGDSERNDHFYPEIFDLRTTRHFQIEIHPVDTKYWRLGFSFLKRAEMPNLKGGRHYDTERVDIHLSVGELIDGRWALKNQIELNHYHINPDVSDFARNTKYSSDGPLVLMLSHNDITGTIWTIEIAYKSSTLGSRRYNLKGFEYFVVSAWADNNEFELDTRLRLTQPTQKV